MNNTITELLNRKKELEDIERKASNYLKSHTIDGRISTSASNGVIQYYYHKIGERGRGTYIRKDNISTARDIIMYNYNEKILKIARQWRRWISNTLSTIPKQTIADVYTSSKRRKPLITPYEISDEEYVDKWLQVQYDSKPFSDGMPEIYTERGERVRSKSEKLIADKLYMLNIPYRYEQPLQLRGYGTVYPDFTILNTHNRREIIYEHFGMMDNEDYAKCAIKKINNYLAHGYRWGVNFIATFETQESPFDVRILEKMINY